jgi:hypothetical protein
MRCSLKRLSALPTHLLSHSFPTTRKYQTPPTRHVISQEIRSDSCRRRGSCRSSYPRPGTTGRSDDRRRQRRRCSPLRCSGWARSSSGAMRRPMGEPLWRRSRARAPEERRPRPASVAPPSTPCDRVQAARVLRHDPHPFRSAARVGEGARRCSCQGVLAARYPVGILSWPRFSRLPSLARGLSESVAWARSCRGSHARR